MTTTLPRGHPACSLLGSEPGAAPKEAGLPTMRPDPCLTAGRRLPTALKTRGAAGEANAGEGGDSRAAGRQESTMAEQAGRRKGGRGT
mmetsp:Transcript_4837/g.18331  ORF Transcript_4837/g.18331 Transcript_4837/m.18331 type:complete len:88 (+) Transcript_4837:2372-2635(+)